MKKIILIVSGLFSLLLIQANSSIHVEHYGKGSPVVILAGLGGTDVWLNCVQEFSAKNTCYLISVKGLDGEKNVNNPDYAIIEKEIIDYLKKEKVLNPVLIGHSFGGFMAMQLASDYPAFFKKLIMVDSYPFALAIYNPAFTQEFGIQQASLIRKQLTELTETAYQTFWAQNVQQFTLDTLLRKSILQKIVDSEKRFVVEAQSYVISNDLRQKLQNIQCPAVALCSSYMFKKAGLSSEVIQTRINDQFRNIKDCNIFINDQSRHFIMLDSKDWFLENLKKNI